MRTSSPRRSRGAPVPRPLGYDGETLLVQQRLAGQRLSQALAHASSDDVETLLERGLLLLDPASQLGDASQFRIHSGGDGDRLGLVGRRVSALNPEGLLVCTTMLGPAQRADGGGADLGIAIVQQLD